MKKLISFLGLLLLTGCSTTWHVSTTGHDPIYDTVLEVPAGVQIDTLSASQLRWKLRTDFRFRYDFAQYALSQPVSFDWNNRVLGNRFNRYSPYWSYSYSWNRDMMWNDWVWGYPYSNWGWNSWSSWNRPYWGYNNYYGWNNYGWNNWGWNDWGYRQRMNDYAWRHRNRTNTAYVVGRRSSNNVVVGNRTNIIRDRVIVNRNKPRVNVKEEKIDLIVNKIRKRVNNNNIRVYNNPNNPNLNNNSKPRVYVRPNNNSNNNTSPRIYNRPPVNTNNSSTRPSSNVSRSNSVSRGGNSNRKN